MFVRVSGAAKCATPAHLEQSPELKNTDLKQDKINHNVNVSKHPYINNCDYTVWTRNAMWGRAGFGILYTFHVGGFWSSTYTWHIVFVCVCVHSQQTSVALARAESATTAIHSIASTDAFNIHKREYVFEYLISQQAKNYVNRHRL
jgi:hypothetical protein